MTHRLALTFLELDVPAFDQPDSPPNSPLDSPPSLMTTYRFAVDTDYLPTDIDAIPSIRNVEVSPAIISLGENLGQRATLTVKLRDHKHTFVNEGFDSGTFWGKFRARYGLKLQGSQVRLIQGFLGEALEDMETRTFIVETTDGPSTSGEFKIIAKDLFKLADGDRAQAPVPSNGFLSANIAVGATSLTVSPSGVGDEYPGAGYANIGGKEIVAFTRDTLTVLLLHADDGVDGSTTITDSSGFAHTWVATGNAQLDVTQSKFGPSSILFDGAGDFVRGNGQSNYAFGSNDWTVEMWVMPTAVGVMARTLYDGRPTATTGAYPQLQISVAGVLAYVQNAVTRITGTTVFAVNSPPIWYHVAVARSGGNTGMFVNGVQEGVTYVDATVYLIGAARPVIGISGVDLASNDFAGWVDDVRVINGVAAYTSNFTPPTAAHTLTGNGDVLKITRARYNTVAAAHDAQSRVQLCLEYLAQDVADIINDLMVGYADIDGSLIPLASWQAETGEFLNVVYSALIAEPTAVNKLISELVEQAGLVVWWDDLVAQFRLQVLRAISTAADIYDGETMMAGTLSVTEQPSKRLSQVYTYFGKINPLLSDDQLENYRSTVFSRDLEAEAEYGAVSVKKIYSRWIPIGGRAVAETVNDILLSRFRDPPRRLNFDLFRDESGNTPQVGGGYQVSSWCFQDQAGVAVQVPVQVTSVNPHADHFEVEAEEMLFSVAATSPDNHPIVIDANVNNVNLRTMHDSIYAAPISGDTVTCTIAAGVTVGSTSTATRAFDVGSWPVGVTINLIVLGRIEGKGGAGGAGGAASFVSTSNGSQGSVGGKALYTRYPIFLTTTDGDIWGGGGGGGGGGSWTDGGSFAYGGGGGGGGAGKNGGAGGAGGYGAGPDGSGSTPGGAGAVGTATAGGARGSGGGSSAGNGGNGGGPGLGGASGANGASSNGASGGNAGSAIDGVTAGPITTVGVVGDIRGGQIN